MANRIHKTHPVLPQTKDHVSEWCLITQKPLLGREWVCGGIRPECVEIAEENRDKWVDDFRENYVHGEFATPERARAWIAGAVALRRRKIGQI